MILNKLEYVLMNNPVRRWMQGTVEVKRMRAIAGLKPGGNILEIGCGSGFGTQLILKYFEPAHITATDLDPRMIEVAKQKYDSHHITFQVADTTKLPFPENSFDGVVDFGVLHHIPNWKEALREIWRVLKPGGELVAEDLAKESFESWVMRSIKPFLNHPYADMYTRAKLIQVLTEMGYQNIHSKLYNPLGVLPYLVLRAGKEQRR